jgi:mono/diheme cytochrome c family protein
VKLHAPLASTVVVALFFLLRAPAASAQEAAQFFKNNCAACHTIGGGRLTGPDLKGVTARRDRAWLAQFIPAPIKMIESGDPYAIALQKQSYGLVMPTLPALTPALVNFLIDYIEAQSGTAPQPAAPPPAAFTASDVDAGRALFSGRQRLAAGAPACISCHTVRGVGGLGGGQLAPDLTLVYQRLGARQGLTAWLGAPATPTMQSVFARRAITPAEVAPLVAYFEHSAQQGNPDTGAGLASFAMLGFGAAIIGLVVMDSAWKNRLRSVRRALVERAKRS